MIQNKKLLVFVLIVGLTLVVAGCKKKTQPVDTPTPPDTTSMTEQPAMTPPPDPEPEEVTEGFPTEEVTKSDMHTDDDIARWNQTGVLKTVYFPFDSYELDDGGRAILQANAEWLQTEGTRTHIMVAGHCDERGTIEYNLALGERRASAVRDYMVSLGVDAFRIRIVSYGEELPADPGHDESAWAENRRGEFDIES